MSLELLNWSLALIPVLAMLTAFVWLDTFKLMTLWETVGLLLLGGLAAGAVYPIAGGVIDQLPLGFSFYSRTIAPWVEESVKGAVIVGLFAFNRIGFKLDAVISGFAVGAGFSVVENILYLIRFPELAPSVWMVRGLGTALMHGTTLALMAAIAHEFAEKATRGSAGAWRLNLLWFVPGLLAAGALHMLFNQFPDRPLEVMIATLAIAPFVIMGIFKFGAHEAGDWLEEEQAGHRAQLAELAQGRFPADAACRRLAALAERSGPKAGDALREYLRAKLELVLIAETTLARQAGDEQRVKADAAAAFAEAEQARHALGPALAAAADPLLPLSRNDQWEVSELKERLKSRTR